MNHKHSAASTPIAAFRFTKRAISSTTAAATTVTNPMKSVAVNSDP